MLMATKSVFLFFACLALPSSCLQASTPSSVVITESGNLHLEPGDTHPSVQAAFLLHEDHKVNLKSVIVKIDDVASPSEKIYPDSPKYASNEKIIVMGTSAMVETCVLALSLIVSMIVCLYWRKGPFVIVKVLIYLLALATMKGAVKEVEDGSSFKFPLFLTATHCISGAIVAFAVLFHASMSTGVEISKPSPQHIATRFGPIACSFAGSIAMNNMALVYSTSSFVEIVGSSQPVVTVLMTLFMGQAFDLRLLGPCLVVVTGCALTSNGTPSFSTLGLLLAAGSNFPRAVKTVLQSLLLQQDANSKTYAPLEVLAWTCLPASAIMLVWSLIQEGTAPYHQWYQHGFASQLTLAMLVAAVNATILNTAVLFVVKDLGAVGSQLVAQTKSLLVILGGMCLLKEQVSRMEIVGYSLVMLGVYAYNDLESRNKAKREGEKLALLEKNPEKVTYVIK